MAQHAKLKHSQSDTLTLEKRSFSTRHWKGRFLVLSITLEGKKKASNPSHETKRNETKVDPWKRKEGVTKLVGGVAGFLREPSHYEGKANIPHSNKTKGTTSFRAGWGVLSFPITVTLDIDNARQGQARPSYYYRRLLSFAIRPTLPLFLLQYPNNNNNNNKQTKTYTCPYFDFVRERTVASFRSNGYLTYCLLACLLTHKGNGQG